MLDIKYIKENRQEVLQMLRLRRTEADIEQIIRLHTRYTQQLSEIEKMQSERNSTSKEIGKLKREGKDTAALTENVRQINERITALETDNKETKNTYEQIMLTIPNILDPSTPIGENEGDNMEVRKWGQQTTFDFNPKDHVDLVETLGIVDLQRASKLSGARFALYRGWGARLERALAQFMLDVHTKEHGYTEYITPYLVTEETMTNTGQLPKFKDDLFKTENFDLYMIPTAEVPLTNIFANEIIKQTALPIKMTAFTPCFRSEAGSYGKDVRGLIRQHQFNKVELVWLTHPKDSMDALEQLTKDAESILQRLELPYRVITLCSADIGFSAAKTYDLEVWLPSQNTYREISSCSNCLDFQARRARIRYRDADKQSNELVHTLNGSGLAVGRTFLALLENYQQRDGSVIIPDALRPYLDGLEKIVPGI